MSARRSAAAIDIWEGANTVFWPSTTNRSSWKNWLTTVCLCVENGISNFHILENENAISPCFLASARGFVPPYLFLQIETALQTKSRFSPSSSAAPSIPAVSAPALPSPQALRYCVRGRHLLCAVWRTRGNCMRRTGRIDGEGSGTEELSADFPLVRHRLA